MCKCVLPPGDNPIAVNKYIISFKLHFSQNSALVQIYASPSDSNSVGNISGNHFVEVFSSHPSHHKSAVLAILISIEGKVKNNPETGQENMGEAPMLSHYSLLRNPRPNRLVCWSIVVKEIPTLRSLFFGAFPSDFIPKGTKDVSVNLFIHSINICKLCQRIRVTLWS